MKRIATIVLALTLAATSATAQQPRYGWSISRSPTSPSDTSGPVPSGIATLYLWLACAFGEGMSASDIGVTVSTGNVILAFTTANGFLNAGSSTALLLAVGGCPTGPIVAGSFLILKNFPLDMCFTGANVTVDCAINPTAWPHIYEGFSETSDPCGDLSSFECEGGFSVEKSSWGSIKGLYR